MNDSKLESYASDGESNLEDKKVLVDGLLSYHANKGHLIGLKNRLESKDGEPN